MGLHAPARGRERGHAPEDARQVRSSRRYQLWQPEILDGCACPSQLRAPKSSAPPRSVWYTSALFVACGGVFGHTYAGDSLSLSVTPFLIFVILFCSS